MTSTVHHDGIVPDEPELRTGSVVVGIGDRVREHDHSLSAAAEWAARRGVDVKLVMGADTGEPSDDLGAYDEQRRQVSMAEVRAAADQLAFHADLTQRVHAVVSGMPAAELLIKESETASLIVLQRRELRPFARLRAGSTSAVVASRAHCPVLVVHADDAVHGSDRQRGILIGVDQRGHAGRAIADAFEEASFRGVSLTALLAWSAPVYGYIPPDDSELQLRSGSAAATLGEQLAGCQEQYPDVELHQLVQCGDPAPALIDLTRHHELLVVARHTEGHHGKRNLGSVTRRVIEEASCPVLVSPTARDRHARHHHRRVAADASTSKR